VAADISPWLQALTGKHSQATEIPPVARNWRRKLNDDVLHVRMETPACDGEPCSDEPLPLWAEIAGKRKAQQIGDELRERLGVSVAMVMRTHWDRDGEVCAHIADRCFRITRDAVTEKAVAA
jgi:hypothetical protein